MGPQKFIASNTAEALKMVKAKMGPDAMVLSTKDTNEGVEVTAITPDDLSQLSNQSPEEDRQVGSSSSDSLRSHYRNAEEGFQVPQKSVRVPPRSVDLGRSTSSKGSEFSSVPQVSIADALQQRKRSQKLSQQEASESSIEPYVKPANFPTLEESNSSAVPLKKTSKETFSQDSRSAPTNVDQLLSEINEVKQLIQSQVAGNFWNSIQQDTSTHAEIVKHLLNSGFSPKLCADIAKNLSKSTHLTTLLQEARSHISSLIRTVDPFSIFDQGGVFAFIGPTGVGKTTTVAKIAARCVLRYGRNQVALLTTDTYRIGAQEQLKVFAKILGLPVVSLRDSDDLSAKLKDLSNRKVILLDTAGVSQRDTLMVEQSQMLQDGSRNAFRILVMSSTTDLRTQEDVISLHNQAAKAKDMPGIGAAVITKTDEATQLAPVIDCLIRNNLPLMFLSNGQRVPEDLSQPDIAYLSHRALRSRSYSDDLAINDDQIPAILSDHLTDWIKQVNP
jgi:flagellar biosynthesis protein FlhF